MAQASSLHQSLSPGGTGRRQLCCAPREAGSTPTALLHGLLQKAFPLRSTCSGDRLLKKTTKQKKNPSDLDPLARQQLQLMVTCTAAPPRTHPPVTCTSSQLRRARPALLKPGTTLLVLLRLRSASAESGFHPGRLIGDPNVTHS